MLWLTLLNGCLTLDTLLPFHNNIPCSEVDDSTCEEADNDWDKVCITCDMDYDWDRVAPWRELGVPRYPMYPVRSSFAGSRSLKSKADHAASSEELSP